MIALGQDLSVVVIEQGDNDRKEHILDMYMLIPILSHCMLL